MCATVRSASRSSASPGWLISRVACPRCASRHRGQLPPHAQLDLTPDGRGRDVRPGGDTPLLFVFERALRWTASNITNPAPAEIRTRTSQREGDGVLRSVTTR